MGGAGRSFARRSLLGCLVAGASIAGTVAGCSDAGTESLADGGDTDGGACWPPSADTRDDASGTGCTPLDTLPVCQVPSGSSVLADGATIAPDGAPAPSECTSACGVSEYALSCTGASPDTALRCTVVPIPTPSNGSFFCCPCATGAP
jgi:hypothetical protein